MFICLIIFIIIFNKINNNDLLNKIKDLEEKNIQLTDKIRNLENNNIILTNLTKKVNNLENNNEQLINKVKDLDDINKQLNNLSYKISYLENINNNVTNNLNNLKINNSKSFNDLGIRIIELENDSNKKINNVTNIIGIIDKNNSKYFNDLEIQIKTLENDQNKQVNNLTEEIKFLETNLSNFNNNFSDNINNIENKIVKLSNDYYSYNVFDDIFPIGSYYISSNSENPSKFFGGKWEQLKDRFIIGASDKYKVNSLGGEEKHKLTIDEMPSHRHNSLDWEHRGMYLWGGNDNSGDGPAAGYGFRTHAIDVFTSWQGGNSAHNNIPPYKAAYIWRRTA